MHRKDYMNGLLHRAVLLLLLFCCFISASEPQSKKESLFQLTGYIKHETFWDSRQVVGIGEDQVMLFPEPKVCDDLGNDINNTGQFNSVPIETRLGVEINGPRIKNFNTLGYIEGDFFGTLFPQTFLDLELTNIFRMRHAFFKLIWKNVELLIGQAYHPMYTANCEPRTIGFNTGVPIDSFSRNPQLSLFFELNPLIIRLTAATQLDFISDGPIGFNSIYMRDAVVPNLDIRFDWLFEKHTLGIVLDYKRIQPRLETNLGFKTDATLNSASAAAFCALNWENFSACTKLIFAQNGTDIQSIQQLISGPIQI